MNSENEFDITWTLGGKFYTITVKDCEFFDNVSEIGSETTISRLTYRSGSSYRLPGLPVYAQRRKRKHGDN